MHAPLTQCSQSGLTMLFRHRVGTYQGRKLTCSSLGSPQPQLSQLAEPLWTDSGLKNGIGMWADLHFKKKNALGEGIVKPSSIVLLGEEKKKEPSSSSYLNLCSETSACGHPRNKQQQQKVDFTKGVINDEGFIYMAVWREPGFRDPMVCGCGSQLGLQKQQLPGIRWVKDHLAWGWLFNQDLPIFLLR